MWNTLKKIAQISIAAVVFTTIALSALTVAFIAALLNLIF